MTELSSTRRETLTLAAVCMTTTDDKARNIDTALRLVQDAANQGAEWIQLPEMFPYMGPYERIYEMAEETGGALYQTLANLAKRLGIVLIAGTVGERPDEASTPKSDLLNEHGQRRVFNTTYVFGRDGQQLAKYRKTHLFNLNGDDGRPRYCESDGFIPGREAVTFSADGWHVGLAICYDLRFPEWFDCLARKGFPDILCVPSAFTKMTGAAHWELMLRARAVERQAYVFAANQTGVHAPGKESYGHSVIIDPWGTILSDTQDREGVAINRISYKALVEIRSRLPALVNRRAALYGK